MRTTIGEPVTNPVTLVPHRESPEAVVRRYLGCLNAGDFEGMMALLDDGEVYRVPAMGTEASRFSAVLLGYQSLMAAGLCITVQDLEVDGYEVHVTVVAPNRIDELLGLAPIEEELRYRVEEGIICEEVHLAEGERLAARSRERKAACAPLVAWIAERYPEEIEELVQPSGRLRVYDRSLIGARRRAVRQIELLEQFGARGNAGANTRDGVS